MVCSVHSIDFPDILKVKGSIIDGSFIGINATTPGSCPSSGIKYLPKSGTSVGSTPTSSGTISVLVSGTKTGGLLSYGTWSTQTPGTMNVTASGSGFTLTSRRGECGIISDKLTCGSGVTASVFTLVSRDCYHLFRITQLLILIFQTISGSNRLLTYMGSTAFTADSTPRGSSQVALYTGSARAVDVTLAFT